jgi:hypothetical protein
MASQVVDEKSVIHPTRHPNFQNNNYSSKGTGPSSSNMNYRDETVMAMLEEADKLSRPIPMENDPPRPKSEPKPIKQITITRTPVKKSDYYAIYGNANYQIHPNGNGTQVHPCGNQNGNQKQILHQINARCLRLYMA